VRRLCRGRSGVGTRYIVTHTHTYIRIYTHTYNTYIQKYVCLYVYTRMCTYIRIVDPVCVCVYVNIRLHVGIYVGACVYIT
jgi:hypothetical protein